ncbi:MULTISPECIES: preprotein translocase subunit YajC [Clostridium]|uniref:preprotein translocase subunit YajC n=1 Tax=Clostridium TaxID=1485 RepID=UPI000826DC62|nr:MULTISPECIES: preprotein translocase subunit YajC [Clostridium]PJI09754.1 preprotein translocase subunit YajC [Clostridium sp. CT7]
MSGTLVTVLYIVGLLAVFYLALWLPERSRKKKFNKMISELRVNENVVTRGGIMGKITNIQSDYIILQTGPDKTKLKIKKVAISNVEDRTADSEK